MIREAGTVLQPLADLVPEPAERGLAGRAVLLLQGKLVGDLPAFQVLREPLPAMAPAPGNRGCGLRFRGWAVAMGGKRRRREQEELVLVHPFPPRAVAGAEELGEPVLEPRDLPRLGVPIVQELLDELLEHDRIGGQVVAVDRGRRHLASAFAAWRSRASRAMATSTHSAVSARKRW